MFDWQTWLAIGICLAAAAYVALRAWRAMAGKKTSGCGSGCGTCPSNAAPNIRQIIAIEPPRRPE